MPGIQVEFDAMEDAEAAARASGADHGRIFVGLFKMWTRVFRSGSDHVTRALLSGFFMEIGADLNAIIEALVTFEFLEGDGDGWRVKGARDRILRGKAARRAGGLAARANLLPGGRQPSAPSAPAETQPSAVSAAPRLPADQLPASSFQPPAVKASRASRARASARPPLELLTTPPAEPPAWTALIERCCQVFGAVKGTPYAFTPRDAGALKRLREKHADELIVAAWDRAQRHAGFPTVATLWELEANWNHFSAPRAAPASGVRHQRAEAQNHRDDTPF